MPAPFELGPGVTVDVVPPSVPTLQMQAPESTSVLVVPIAGPPGDSPGLDLLISRVGSLEQTVYSYLWEQTEPSTVWLIEHPLQFIPAGIEVFDHVGTQHHPLVSWPDAGTVRLDFNTPVYGTARLS